MQFLFKLLMELQLKFAYAHMWVGSSAFREVRYQLKLSWSIINRVSNIYPPNSPMRQLEWCTFIEISNNKIGDIYWKLIIIMIRTLLCLWHNKPDKSGLTRVLSTITYWNTIVYSSSLFEGDNNFIKIIFMQKLGFVSYCVTRL